MVSGPLMTRRRRRLHRSTHSSLLLPFRPPPRPPPLPARCHQNLQGENRNDHFKGILADTKYDEALKTQSRQTVKK